MDNQETILFAVNLLTKSKMSENSTAAETVGHVQWWVYTASLILLKEALDMIAGTEQVPYGKLMVAVTMALLCRVMQMEHLCLCCMDCTQMTASD